MRQGLLVLLIALAAASEARAQDGGVIEPPDAEVPIGDGGVTPGSGLVVEPTFLDLGQVGPGTPALDSFDLRNSDSVGVITVSGVNKPATPGCAGFSLSPPGALPRPMAAGQVDPWGVTFSSSTTGSHACRVDILDDDGNTDFIDLSALVATPVMVVSPLSLTFGDVVVGGSGWDGFSISNTGMAPLTINSVTPAGSADFLVMSPGASFEVAAMDSVFVNVMYTPGGVGTDSGSVVISGNAPGNPSDTVAMSGNGVTESTAPHLTLSPSPVAFGSTTVGGTVDRTLSIGNDGGQSAGVSSIAITGPGAAHFTIEGFGCTGTQSCAAPLTVPPGGAPVTGALRCRPTSAGSKSATVTVTSDASNSPTSASLTCTGNGAVVSLDRTDLDFGTIRVGTPATIDLTVANLGNVNLTYTLARSGAAAADYAVAPACSSTCTLGPGLSQVHTITFTPAALGSRNITLVVASNDPLAPTRNVSVAGAGGGGVLTLVQPAGGDLPFGDIPVGVTSAAQTVRIRNDGNLSLRVTSTALADATGYALSGTTAPPDLVLAPGEGHSLAVTCTPPEAMTYSTDLVYQSDAPSNPTRTIALTCRGLDTDLVATPAPVNFEPTRVGDARVVNVTVQNTGTAAIDLTGLTASPGVFTIEGAPGLPHTVPGGGDFDLDLRFTPSGDGDVAGALVITPSSGDALTVVLLGPGRVASFTLTPESADFGTVCSGSTTVQRFTLASTGSADFEVDLPVLLDPDGAFDLTMIAPAATAYPITLAPSSTATMDVAAAPTGAAATGTLEISTDVEGSALTADLAIQTVASGIAVSPGAIEFGAVLIDEQSTARDLTLANCDPTPLDLTAVRITGSDAAAFAVGGTLPPPAVTVPVAGSVRWTVVFSPARAGAHQAVLEVEHAGATVMIPLSGFGGDAPPDAGPGGGDGGTGFDTTSYYACGCRAPAGDPGGAATVLAVLAWLLWPRRRRP